MPDFTPTADGYLLVVNPALELQPWNDTTPPPPDPGNRDYIEDDYITSDYIN
jgi:hypothetical protein